MKYFYRMFFILIAISIVTMASCSRGPKKPDGFPDLVPCKLILTQGSAPIEGVNVSLMKKEESYPWFVGGTSDAAGIVELRTQDKFIGAPAGDFIIVCQKTVIDDSTANSAMPSSYSAIPLKMGSVETSPLKITIGTDSVEQTIDLGPKVRENFPGPPTSI